MLAVMNYDSYFPLGGSVASQVLIAPCAFELLAATTSHTFYYNAVDPSGPSSHTLVTVNGTPIVNYVLPSELDSPVVE